MSHHRNDNVERRFLLRKGDRRWEELVEEQADIEQGYFSSKAAVHVYIINKATAVIHVYSIQGTEVELSYEYQVPMKHAHEMLALCQKGSNILPMTHMTLRVRIKDNSHGFICIKGPKGTRGKRLDHEYSIPIKDAKKMLTLCGNHRIVKVRQNVKYKRRLFEIDVFITPKPVAVEGRGETPLIIVEVEAPEDEINNVNLPPWLDEEITDRRELSNSNLASNGIPADIVKKLQEELAHA